MAPDAIAHRAACVAFAAAIAGLAPAVDAQMPYPRDPRLIPQQVQDTAPQDAASGAAQDAANANPQAAAQTEQFRDAERSVETVLGTRSSFRPPPAPWRIVPRVGIAESYSDNVARAPSASAQSGWLTALTPGVRVEGGGGRLRGYLDYQLSDNLYANQSQLNNLQNRLDSRMNLEAIDDWLFLEARAGIQQLSQSAFGSSTAAATGADLNRAETSFLQLSPYVRGTISDKANYQLRYNGTVSRTSTGVIPENRTAEWVGRIRNAPSTSLLGWTVDGRALSLHDPVAGTRTDSRVRVSLMYALYPELHLSVYEGIEIVDYGSTNKRSATPGFGVDWVPGARTNAAAIVENRFFGTGHAVLLSHRTPLMAFRFSDNKDVSVLPGDLAAGGRTSLSAMLSDLLAYSVPDPVAREAAVRAELERTGRPEGTPGGTAFLINGASVTQRREASLTLLGKFNTVALSWRQNKYHAIGDNSLGLVGNTNGTQNLSQQGYNASWSYRLTPLTSITLQGAYFETRDLNATNFASEEHLQSLTLRTQVGPKAWLSAGARRVRFDSSAASGYRENALVGTASLLF